MDASSASPPPPPSAAAARPNAPLAMPLPASVDRRVFDELPAEIQREILAEHARQASRTSSRSSGSGESETTLRGQQPSAGDSSEGAGGWECRVCTFANHPELDECEMCETLRVDVDAGFGSHAQAPMAATTTAASPTRSAVSRSLRRIRLPATPAATALTNRAEPTADDLLLAATSKLHQLQLSASKGLLHAKDALLGGGSSSGSPGGSGDSSEGNPSAQAALELAVLQRDLNQKCEPGDALFETGLERLWHAAYSERGRARAFEREGDGWLDLGFQRANPETDFRGGGMLALKCLQYAFEAHPREMRAILDAQKPPPNTPGAAAKKKKWYPVSVAGINVTCMLAGLLKLGNGAFEHTPAPFWPLFEEPAAFYQLFFHAFLKMDATWRRMNASYMEFGVVLKATRRMVAHMLAQAPRSLDELRAAADRTFVDGFVVSLSSRFLADSENGECPDPYNALEDETEIILTATRSASRSKARAASADVWPLR